MSITRSFLRIFSVLLIVVIMLAAMPVQVSHAAGVLYVKPAASDTGDCSSWANACILQTALTGAVSGYEIWVAAGTYKPTTDTTNRTATFQLIDGVAVYGGFIGTETARTQRNPTVNVTILSGDIDNNDSQTPIITDIATVDGNTTNSYHVVTGATGATLDGFTITAGNANGSSDPNENGGGMYNNSSSPTLTNVTFSSNSAYGGGGGMYNGSSSNPTLTDVTFSGNSAGGGGGMQNYNSSNPTLMNVTFSSNWAHSGGGMQNWQSSSPQLMNVTFSGNVVFEGDGGGMFNALSSPTLTNVTFSSNWAISFGGGGMSNDTSSPTLTNVTFSSNWAKVTGGGMENYLSNPTLTNVTFSGNSATNSGGGMNNSYKSSPAMIHNTIFWGNAAGSGAQIYNADAGSKPFMAYDVVQGGCPSGSTCTIIITADPKLGTLGNYGGFTWTIPILPGSSAIDTGYDTTCPATDQRGVTRPQGAHCDIGAFEAKAQYTISGNAEVAGTTLSYTDGTAKTATADGSGNYSFTVSPNWSGTVTPSKAGYTFSPASHTYTNVEADQTDQNYAAFIYYLYLPLVMR
jgi:predicted outer membrane repeat protein